MSVRKVNLIFKTEAISVFLKLPLNWDGELEELPEDEDGPECQGGIVQKVIPGNQDDKHEHQQGHLHPIGQDDLW